MEELGFNSGRSIWLSLPSNIAFSCLCLVLLIYSEKRIASVYAIIKDKNKLIEYQEGEKKSSWKLEEGEEE